MAVLTKKFNRVIGVGVLSGALFMAGCSVNVSTTAQEDKQGFAVLPEKCAVVDLNTSAYQIPYPGPQNAATYNFKTGAVTFNTFTGIGRSNLGSSSTSSQTIPMKDLAADGQVRALEMFSKLPASAQCKAPKFGG
jgi:hypothetical protein